MLVVLPEFLRVEIKYNKYCNEIYPCLIAITEYTYKELLKFTLRFENPIAMLFGAVRRSHESIEVSHVF